MQHGMLYLRHCVTSRQGQGGVATRLLFHQQINSIRATNTIAPSPREKAESSLPRAETKNSLNDTLPKSFDRPGFNRPGIEKAQSAL